MLESNENHPYNHITNMELQGFFYSLLKDTRYHNLHNNSITKFFTFSPLLPIRDYKKGEQKTIIFSTPTTKLANTIYHRLKSIDSVRLKDKILRIKNIEKLSKINFQSLITKTPITLFKTLNKKEDVSFISFKNDSVDFFLDKLKNNALKKYNLYFNDEYHFDEPLFDSLQYNKEVAVSLKNKNGNPFLVIGSLWDNLVLNNDIESKFYDFIYEAGLGGKNSLGFGFLNKKA